MDEFQSGLVKKRLLTICVYLSRCTGEPGTRRRGTSLEHFIFHSEIREAEQGAWETMVDPGTQEAMADHGARAAMAEQRAWETMVDPGTQEASMAGSPPQNFLGETLHLRGGAQEVRTLGGALEAWSLGALGSRTEPAGALGSRTEPAGALAGALESWTEPARALESWTEPAGALESAGEEQTLRGALAARSWMGPAEKQEGACEERPQEGT